MNAVLALGGSFGSALDMATEENSLKYYGHAIGALKSELTSSSTGSLREALRLLLVTLFLCFSDVSKGVYYLIDLVIDR